MRSKTEQQELIELAIKAFPPERVLEHYDVRVTNTPTSRKGGKELEAACPFHETNDPNFSMNTLTGRWLCRSNFCGKSGNLAHFIALQEGTDDERGLLKLFKFAGIPVPKVDALSQVLSAINSASNVESKIRSVEKPEPIPWSIGWKQLVHPYFLRKRGIPPSIQKEARTGIIQDAPFYQYRACIPVLNGGQLYSMYSRAIATEKSWMKKFPQRSADVKKFFPRHHYSGESLTSHLIYGIDDVNDDEVILVEAILSVLKLRSLGFDNAVAILKARISQEQIHMLLDRGFSRIIVCTDNDRKESKDKPGTFINPGMKAGWDIYRKLSPYFETGVARLPVNVDPADMIEASEFQKVVDDIQWPQDTAGSPKKLQKIVDETMGGE